MASSDESQRVQFALERAARHMQSSNYSEVVNLLIPVLDILHRPGYVNQLLNALYDLGIGYSELGAFRKAQICLEEGLGLARTMENKHLIHCYLHELALVAFHEERLSDSLDLSSEALTIALAINDDVGNTIMHISVLYQLSENFNEARQILQAARANAERNLDTQLLARILNELGLVEFELGNYKMGVESFIESLSLKQSIGDSRGIQKSMTNLQKCFRRFPSAIRDPEVRRLIDRATS